MSRIRSGIFWVAITRYATRGIGVVTTLVLAGMLSPRDFGLMGGAMIIISLFEQLYDFGISKEIIARQERVSQAAQTAFTLNVVLGSLLFLVIVLIAPFAETFLGLAGLSGLFILTGVSLVASSVGKVPAALLQKEQRFRTLTVPTSAAAVTGSAAAIISAYLGAGAYSLAIREVVASGVESAWLLVAARFRPQLSYDRMLAREILWYAKHLLGALTISAVIKQIPATLIARFFGAAPLGAYSFAGRIAYMPTKEVGTVLNRVLFPSFAERRSDPAALSALVLRSTRLMAMVAVPAALFTALLAGPLLHLLYGAKWDHAVPFFQVLPFLALLMTLCGPVGEAVKAVGRPDVQLGHSVIQLLAMLALLYPAVVWLGAVGVAVAETAAALVAFVWFTWRATVALGIDYARFSASWLGMGAYGAASAATIVAVRALAPAQMPGLVLVQCAGALIVFVAAVLYCDGAFVRSLLPGAARSRGEVGPAHGGGSAPTGGLQEAQAGSI